MPDETLGPAGRLVRHAWTGGNLIVSPADLRGIVALLALSSRGETRRELTTGCGLPARDAGLKALLATAVRQAPPGAQRAPSRGLSIWADVRLPLEATYLALMRELSVTITSLDFTPPDPAAAAVNEWAARRTRGMIPRVIEPGDVPGANGLSPAGLILASVLSFSGRWVNPFEIDDTRPASFFAAGGPRTVDMMHRTGQLEYAEDDRCQVAEIPFRDSYGFVVVLPGDATPVESLWPALTTPGRDRVPLASLARREVSLHLPSFDMARTFDVRRALMTLDRRAAFDPDHADFSPLSPLRPLWIDSVRHHAAIRVHERGADAAAVTRGGLAVARGSASEVMRVDRPFLFLLRHRPTGDVLFCGALVDPDARGARGRAPAA